MRNPWAMFNWLCVPNFWPVEIDQMNRHEIIATIKSREPALKARGVEHLALFGSRTRGDSGPQSDLDVLIDIVPGQRFSLLDLSSVGLLIEDATGISSQIVLRRSVAPDFAARIADELVPVF